MGFFNVAPKKEMFFIYHFPKEYVGRSIQNAVNTKLYINTGADKQQDIKGSIS